MKLIKQAIVYRADLPACDALAVHLAEMPYQKIADVEFGRPSFIQNKVTGELVTPFAGGYGFTFRYDEKILPAASVKRVADERVAALCEANGIDKLSTPARRQLLEDVRVDLAKTALVKTTIIDAFYHADTRTLIVAAGSESMASNMMRRLVQVVGSVKTTTINISDIKNGLTARLKAHLGGEKDAFDHYGFEPDQKVKLVRDREIISYSVDYLDGAGHSIMAELETGYQVDRIGMVHSGVEFQLTSDFHFKGISFERIELDEDEDEPNDKANQWRITAATQTALLVGVVDSLCDLLGYKAEPEGE